MSDALRVMKRLELVRIRFCVARRASIVIGKYFVFQWCITILGTIGGYKLLKIVFLPQRFPFRQDYFQIPYTFLIKIQREQSEDCANLINVINKNAYTLYYKEMQSLENEFQGWKIYHTEQEFVRMGVTVYYEGQQQGVFKYLNNEGGQICATYYNKLIVPSKIDMDCIQKTAKSRSKERIPILSYAFQVNGKIVSLWRSSQRIGIEWIRSLEDEQYLKKQMFQQIINKQKINLRKFNQRFMMFVQILMVQDNRLLVRVSRFQCIIKVVVLNFWKFRVFWKFFMRFLSWQ